MSLFCFISLLWVIPGTGRLFHLLAEVFVVKDHHNRERYKIADQGDQKCEQQAVERMHVYKILIKSDIIDTPQYVCRAEDDQDGQKRTNLMVKDTLV